jgi:hypothetical protein
MMLGRFFGKTGRGRAVAVAILAAVGLTTAPYYPPARSCWNPYYRNYYAC